MSLFDDVMEKIAEPGLDVLPATFVGRIVSCDSDPHCFVVHCRRDPTGYRFIPCADARIPAVRVGGRPAGFDDYVICETVDGQVVFRR